ncbi:MAG: DUF6209 family protein [Actinomycetota bacterium]
MSTLEHSPPPAKSIVQFLPAWTELVSGQVRAGTSVLIEYDPTRLLKPAPGRTPQEVVAHVRIHPGGRELTRSLFQRPRAEDRALERTEPWVHELEIPDDAVRLELWFRVTDGDGTIGWDTRYGANYWLDILPAHEPPSIPADFVAYRWGAVPRLDLIHVVSERVAKHRTVASPHSLSIETRLVVQVWAAGAPGGCNVWLDTHVFDEGSHVVDSATFPLEAMGPAESGGRFFVVDRPIHEGSSLVPPGSVARAKCEAVRKLQYRLYCELEGQTYTDGLLHQHDLPPDAATVT